MLNKQSKWRVTSLSNFNTTKCLEYVINPIVKELFSYDEEECTPGNKPCEHKEQHIECPTTPGEWLMISYLSCDKEEVCEIVSNWDHEDYSMIDDLESEVRCKVYDIDKELYDDIIKHKKWNGDDDFVVYREENKDERNIRTDIRGW